MCWMVMMTSAWCQQQLVPWIQLTGWHTRYVRTYTSLFSNVCSLVTSNNHLASCHITSPPPHLIFPHVHPHLTSCSPSSSPHLMFTPTSPHVHPHLHLTSCSPPPHLMFTLTFTSLHVYPHPHLTSFFLVLILASPYLHFMLTLTSPHLMFTLTSFYAFHHLTSLHIHTDLTFTSSPHLYFMPTLTLTSPLLSPSLHLLTVPPFLRPLSTYSTSSQLSLRCTKPSIVHLSMTPQTLC